MHLRASRTCIGAHYEHVFCLCPQVMVCVWEVGVLLWLPFLAVFLTLELALWSANLIKVGAEETPCSRTCM